MARPPNFDFERRERQKEKDAKRAAKMEAKREKKDGEAQSQLAKEVVHGMDAAIAHDETKN